MILFDTNILSELMKLSPDHNVVREVNHYPAEVTFISAITHAEILQGIALLDEGKRKQKLAHTAQQILQLFARRTLAFDRESAPFYASVIQQRRYQGRPIAFPDAQIAAIAMQHNLTLLTRNVRDFEAIEGLVVENPWL